MGHLVATCHLISPQTQALHSTFYSVSAAPWEPGKFFRCLHLSLPLSPFPVSFGRLSQPGKKQEPISRLKYAPTHQGPMSISLLPSAHLVPPHANDSTKQRFSCLTLPNIYPGARNQSFIDTLVYSLLSESFQVPVRKGGKEENSSSFLLYMFY